ncbi:hypothetical protein Hanom_Chr06g00569411 [Helianthus anomalus]
MKGSSCRLLCGLGCVWEAYNVYLPCYRCFRVNVGTKFCFGVLVGFGCVSDPAMHLVVTSLGGLQCFLWSSH